ncbi:diguanylate cyclase (GGDEF)-like protein [Oxalobacteraceae bacterium GrIS 2.11]
MDIVTVSNTASALPNTRPSNPETSRYAWLTGFVLGHDPKQRATINFLFLTALIFLVLLYILFYGMGRDIFEEEQLATLAWYWAFYTCGLYAIIRAGLNQRCSDKSLALPQTCIAQTFMAFVYAYSGVAHTSVLLMLPLIMVFGIFNMTKRSTYISFCYTVALIGLMMYYKANTDPMHYSASIEWVSFAMTTTVLAVIAQLSIRCNRMRRLMKLQARQLEAAYLHVQEISTRDELTGLCNRRYLKSLLDQHVERHMRTGGDFYLAMIDLDHFKRVNDSFGHHVGDEVLKRLSQCTCELLRKTDTIGRWGGEEFLLLLPETGKDQVLAGLERLHRLVGTMPMVTAPPLYVTFSAGLTKYRSGEHIEQTLKRVDLLLYQAKNRGRNQIVHDEQVSVCAVTI